MTYGPWEVTPDPEKHVEETALTMKQGRKQCGVHHNNR